MSAHTPRHDAKLHNIDRSAENLNNALNQILWSTIRLIECRSIFDSDAGIQAIPIPDGFILRQNRRLSVRIGHAVQSNPIFAPFFYLES